jgi:hypothetical protein
MWLASFSTYFPSVNLRLHLLVFFFFGAGVLLVLILVLSLAAAVVITTAAGVIVASMLSSVLVVVVLFCHCRNYDSTTQCTASARPCRNSGRLFRAAPIFHRWFVAADRPNTNFKLSSPSANFYCILFVVCLLLQWWCSVIVEYQGSTPKVVAGDTCCG